MEYQRDSQVSKMTVKGVHRVDHQVYDNNLAAVLK